MKFMKRLSLFLLVVALLVTMIPCICGKQLYRRAQHRLVL